MTKTLQCWFCGESPYVMRNLMAAGDPVDKLRPTCLICGSAMRMMDSHRADGRREYDREFNLAKCERDRSCEGCDAKRCPKKEVKDT